MSEQFERIKLSLIDEDVKNHRLVTDSASDTQLLESIKANGVQQPIKVVKKENGRYTLVFGFRRKAQADRAGLMEIPAMVVEHMTSGEIRTLQAIENLERKELHPLEEAEFCQELADTLKDQLVKTDETALAEAVAARVGRSLKWVENRLALARLSDRVKASFLDGGIHLQHANLIARLASHDAQEEVLGSVQAKAPPWLNSSGYLSDERSREEQKEPPATIATCRNLVEARLRDLSDVPWLLDKAFDGKPACVDCPHNSANRFELFDGDEPKRPQCLDASCFQEKVKFTSRAVQRATNTLVKSENKPTPANAKKAIEEREVEFVEPKAVADAAKRRADPKQKTSGEKRGEQSWERNHKIQVAFNQRLNEWLEPVEKQLMEKLPGKSDPEGVAILAMIHCTNLVHESNDGGYRDKKLAAAARDRLLKVLKLLASKSKDRMLKAAKLLAADMLEEFDDGFNHPLDDVWHLADDVQKIFSLQIDSPPPTREQVANELYPPAEKKTGARKKKPKSKSKAKAAADK